jgi:hypothetical protein
MTSTVELLAALGTHLAEFELPPIASVHLSLYLSGPPVTVQLSSREPAAIAAGLLAWADNPHRHHHRNLAGPPGRLGAPHGQRPTARQHPGPGLWRAARHRPGSGRRSRTGATTTVTLATLRYLATPGQTRDEVTLR